MRERERVRGERERRERENEPGHFNYSRVTYLFVTPSVRSDRDTDTDYLFI